MIDVTALGERIIDFTMVSADGEDYPAMAAHPGGAPANFLATLAKYGKKTALLGKVGTDTFGRLLRGTLEGADICIRFEELDLSLIDEASAFHFGMLSLTDEPARSTTRQAVAYAKAHGKLVTYDPNFRKPLWKDLDEAKEQMLWGLAQADVVKISEEEVAFLFGLNVQDGAKHILQEFGVKLVFVTCGSDGCFFMNAQASGQGPGMSGIRVVDTTGAGDIFGGSAVYRLLETGKAMGLRIPVTMTRATILASRRT